MPSPLSGRQLCAYITICLFKFGSAIELAIASDAGGLSTVFVGVDVCECVSVCVVSATEYYSVQQYCSTCVLTKSVWLLFCGEHSDRVNYLTETLFVYYILLHHVRVITAVNICYAWQSSAEYLGSPLARALWLEPRIARMYNLYLWWSLCAPLCILVVHEHWNRARRDVFGIRFFNATYIFECNLHFAPDVHR